MSSIDSDPDAYDVVPFELDAPDLVKRAVSQIQLVEPMFGNFSSPTVDKSLRKEPLDPIKHEYESMMTAINAQIKRTNTLITEAESLYEGQDEKLHEEKQKIYNDVKKSRKSLMERINNSKMRRNLDKVTFFLGLAMIQYKSYALGRHSDNGVYWLNMILMIVLLAWRQVSFRMSKTHYYMFEFCYYGNIVIYSFLFLMPTSKFLYYAAFAFGSGPIGWALALVQCSFVIHSVEHLTNCFIHFTPMILMWNMHWYTQYSTTRTWELYDCKNDTFSWTFVKEYYSAALTMYLIWNVGYYLIVFVLLQKRIKERSYDTLVTYHITRNTAPGKLFLSQTKRCGPGSEGIMYVTSHLIGTFIFISLSMICFFSFYFHVFVIMFTSSVSFWNGASFYMDYFSKKYEVNLAQLDELKNKVGEDIGKKKKD